MRLRFCLPLAALVVLVVGCDQGGPDLSVAPLSTPASVQSSVDINGYAVEYLGAEPAAEGTTFRYRVTGSGDVANLNYVFLETACDAAPVALSPSNAVQVVTNTDADTTLVGAQWAQGLGEGESRDYAMTFADAELGLISVVVRAGNRVERALVPGPCGNLFDLAGSVFVNDGDDATDAESRQREAVELGVVQVRVDVYDADGAVVASARTGADGRYAFRLIRGAYTVRVTADGPESDFNGRLFESYTPAAPPSERAVSLTGDVGGVDFGFDPIKEVILENVESGPYQTVGAQPRSTWKRWVRKAARGGKCDPLDADPDTICRDEMAGYLARIFATGEPGDDFIGNPAPFQIDAGTDPFEAALAILSKRAKTEAEELVIELFVVELNSVSGRGIPDALYDQTLIYYLEEAVLRSGAVGTADGARTAAARAAPPTASVDLLIALAYNGGGGGGEVGEN